MSDQPPSGKDLPMDLEKIVEAVEHEVGVGCGAWDMVDPKEIVAAILRLFPAVPQEASDQGTVEEANRRHAVCIAKLREAEAALTQERQQAEVYRKQMVEAERQRDQWKANHDEMVARNQLLRGRKDLTAQQVAERCGLWTQLKTAEQRAEKLEHDLELQREVSAELGRQNEQLIGNSDTLPRDIQELIYRSSCCVPTPEAAQKEPCACVAYAIVEKVEEWAGAQATKRAETAEVERDKAIAEAASLHAEGTLLADQLADATSRLAKVRDALTRLAKWAELSPFAQSVLGEAQAALAEEQP